MGLGGEPWRSRVWHPNLHRPQAFSTQPLAMCRDSLANCMSFTLGHPHRLHVTGAEGKERPRGALGFAVAVRNWLTNIARHVEARGR